MSLNATEARAIISPAQAADDRDIPSKYLKMYGRGCLSYTTQQRPFDHFVTSQGYLPYYRLTNKLLSHRPIHIVVGDPISPPAQFRQIISDFLKFAKPVIFLQAGEAFAGVLDELGLTVNRFGVETELDLPGFDLKGKYKAHLRHWINTAAKAGAEAFECDLQSMRESEVRELSSEWLKRKGGKEMALLTRPFEYRQQPGVRFFWARRDGELLAMVTFDPIYVDGTIHGYYQDLVRCKQGAPNGTPDLVASKAIETFKDEGHRVLALGVSPLSSLTAEPFHSSKLMRRIFESLYEHGNFVYSFKGLEFHKRHYRGIERAVYVASTSRNALLLLRDLITILFALQVF